MFNLQTALQGSKIQSELKQFAKNLYERVVPVMTTVTNKTRNTPQ